MKARLTFELEREEGKEPLRIWFDADLNVDGCLFLGQYHREIQAWMGLFNIEESIADQLHYLFLREQIERELKEA